LLLNSASEIKIPPSFVVFTAVQLLVLNFWIYEPCDI